MKNRLESNGGYVRWLDIILCSFDEAVAIGVSGECALIARVNARSPSTPNKGALYCFAGFVSR